MKVCDVPPQATHGLRFRSFVVRDFGERERLDDWFELSSLESVRRPRLLL